MYFFFGSINSALPSLLTIVNEEKIGFICPASTSVWM
jgi:hypothetical protein